MSDAADYIAKQAFHMICQIALGETADPKGDKVERYIHYYAPKMGTTVAEVTQALDKLFPV